MDTLQEIAQRRADAQPRDYAEDFDGEVRWSVCPDCIRIYLGAAGRIKCHTCNPDKERQTE